MPTYPKSLLDLQFYSSQQIRDLFLKATQLKRTSAPTSSLGKTIALLFFEPSTRTRMSFESAAYRCGLGPMIFDGGPNTSLEKGETVEDSILNVAAMKPQIIVVRCKDEVQLNKLAAEIDIPIINAGWGVKGHPTQALLDAYTMFEAFTNLESKKLLIVGDIRHSRVAASHFELMPKLSVEVGICGPDHFLPEQAGVKVFKNLQLGLQWADAVMALRVQFERHADVQNLAGLEYKKKFGLNSKCLEAFRSDGIIMHPGPINHGIELETEVLSDPRCKIMQQVTNGVFIREAILREYYE